MTIDSARRALLALAAAALTAGVLGACSEKLSSGAACPSLCPSQNVTVLDTTIDPITVDTSIVGYPAKGQEGFLLVANRGSALQTRAVVRFDTLVTKYVPKTGDTAVAITKVLASKVRLSLDTTGSVVTAPVTVDVYDVDTSAPSDYDDAATLALFTPARRIGSATFAVADAKDSLLVPISDSAVLSKIVGNKRLRLGFAVTSSAEAQLKIFSIAAGTTLGPQLRYDATDTTDSVGKTSVAPSSASPAGLPGIASALRDYTINVNGPRPLESDAIGVGGLPARRTYLRFDVPLWLLDSSTVVRAALLLTQRPVHGSVDSLTAVNVVGNTVLAATDLTDIARAATVLSADSLYGVTTLALAPRDSGVRVMELGGLLRAWRTTASTVKTQHAIVLRSSGEGVAGGEVRFFSTSAAADTLRPRLRVTYVPRVDFGVP
ncbi:MAG TPA: hypothetical protein VFJ74_01760 [Gemmatimonadaceae bacterium]|nr:hypothetical protein [Gemmatimonadaceae bacterium]